ncbi:MAG TPA: hypothetical protein VNJ08_08325 [Bacteriovoracaceae bacterium]|nr:hypothetical protein [Bacteriovoracaceae bacterium]
MKKLISVFLILTFVVLTPAMAQEDDFVKTTREDMFTVMGAGAGGAILGLSTLSFVDQPSRHLRNVFTGAALGIIAGVILVTYNSAQRGTEELESASLDFNTNERVAWHASNTQNLTLPKVQFGTQFWSMNF